MIAALPKAELHLHIEGSLEPQLLFDLAMRNNISIPFASVEEISQAYRFSRLQDFLDIYYQGMNVLQTEQDFHDLTLTYLNRVADDNVRHVEIFFDPQGHTARGIEFATVINGISRALAEGRETLGISSYLILSFLRHLSEEDAFATLKMAEPFRDSFIGVGLDSSELGQPPEKFSRVYAQARDMGLKLCAHAGEEGPPAYVYEALDILQVDRIDHGNRAMEDPLLVQRLINSGMTLTVCPLSNLKLAVIDRMANSPVATMLDLGIAATINSDDPAYFGGYINDNFAALDLSDSQLVTLAKNSFRGCFFPEADITAHLSAIDEVYKP
ncbi:MAG TPA: adenosine deaminase [Rhodospirillales bacterium]|nr:adenosine deaminase [Rhodospirillales bacterium]